MKFQVTFNLSYPSERAIEIEASHEGQAIAEAVARGLVWPNTVSIHVDRID